MKKILIVVAFAASLGLVQAQNISGKIIDAQGNPLPFVTVSVLSTDSTLITGAVTDDNGHFSVHSDKGDVIIQTSFIGYTTQCQNLSIRQNTTLPDITLTEETAQLEEVEVRVKRPLVERQMDKIVLNVAESPYAIGNNGKNMLKKAPGVMIDKDGNITVNGKSVEVYIDGRPSYLSGEQLRGMLEGTDAATIEKIEIITNPSSKYDASGQGGIINIKLKRNKSQGLNGMISASYGGMYFSKPQRYFQNDFASLNLNYRGAKTYTSFALTQVYNDLGVQFNSSTTQPGTEGKPFKMRSESDYLLNFQYYMARLTNDWYIDSVNTLGFILQSPIMPMRTDISDTTRNRSQITLGDKLLQDIRTTGFDSEFSPQVTANLNFTHTFCDSLSRELTANMDYNRFDYNEQNQQNNYILINKLGTTLPDKLDIWSYQKVDILSGKLDFQTGFWKTGMLECGAKYAYSQTYNEMNTDSVIASAHHTQNTQFQYMEHVGALYISAAKQFNKQWNAKIGLRSELTSATGIFDRASEHKEVNQKPYINFFPTAFVGYNPTDKWSMSASYTRRIKRPSYYQLNPFITYLDAHTAQMGNPDLSPEFNNQVDFNFGWSQYVSFSINVAHTQNMLNMKTTIRESGDVFGQWVNFGTCTSHGGALSFTEVPLVPKYTTNAEGKRVMDGAWLALTMNGRCFHFLNKSYEGDYVNKNWWWGVFATLTSYLPKDFQISLDGYYDAPITTGYTTYKGSYGMDAAIKKQFLKRTLTLTLQVRDLLRSQRFDMATAGLGEGYSQTIEQEVYGQSVNIGISWMFGQQQRYKHRKVGQLDESSRLGGGGGVGGK